MMLRRLLLVRPVAIRTRSLSSIHPPLRQLKIRDESRKLAAHHVHKYDTKPLIGAEKLAELETLVQKKKYHRAINSFNELNEKSVHSYRWAMEAYNGLFEYAKVIELYQEAEVQFTMPNDIKILYVTALNRLKKFAHTLAAFGDWHHSQLALTTPIYNAILVACGHTLDWRQARVVMEDMKKFNCEPQGSAYFHVILASLRDPKIPIGIPLDLAETAMKSGYPVSTSLISNILILSAKHSREFLDRAMAIWSANKTYGAIIQQHEFPYEVAVQAMWKLGYEAEAVTVVKDLVELRHCTTHFKERLLKDLFQRHLAKEDVSVSLLDLMIVHNIPPLKARTRAALFAACLHTMTMDEIAALFMKYEAVTLGWNAERACDIIIWGHKDKSDERKRASNEVKDREYQQLIKLLGYAFDKDWNLSYYALDHAITWLLELKRYDDCISFVELLLENPNYKVGYRITEIGMQANQLMGYHQRAVQLFEILRDQHNSDPANTNAPFAPRPFMLKTAIRSYEKLKKFADSRRLKAMLYQTSSTKPTKSD